MSECENYSDRGLLSDLEPTAEQLLNQHLAKSKEWFPHEAVPWSRGQDFTPGEEWHEDEFPINPAVRSSLFVNLLTEDNLPYYFRTIERMFGNDSAWGAWARRWTAEEGRHSIVIRDYLTVSRALDPVELERARMSQVELGQVPEPQTPQDGFAYVALQELATRIAHFNTGQRIDDPAGQEVMKKVASDENRHYIFYRDIAKAAFELDPSGMMLATERQVRTFEMPGTGINNFDKHAKAIADAGIYDLQIHHDKILQPVVVRYWDVENVSGLSDEAERARDALLKRIGRIGRAALALTNRAQRKDEAVV
ncbi:acyl-ACP desaturase [Candidatus Saccharibacteria bacterium]|nr:acyl-ACP desaturase [Candidatus Saccharibacteria bacterium]